MKGIFPYDKQEIVFEIPRKDLLNELRKNVQLTGYIPLLKDNKSTQFYGSTMSPTWKISLKTNYRNSFKPVIYLKLLEEGENKTRMILEFKLHIAIRIFMAIFLLIAISFLIYNLFKNREIEAYYEPVGFIAIVFIMSNLGFYLTLEHSAEALNRILGEITIPSTGNSNT